MFIHLHVHSEYSLQDSTLRIQRSGKNPGMVERATELGMTHLALTDHHALFGAFQFEKACKEHGVAPIYGVDLLVEGYPLVLLAESQEGYANLVKLVSHANSDGKVNGIPGVTKAQLKAYARGLIALSGGVAGEVSWALLKLGVDQASLVAHQFIDIFGKDNFFLEITDHGTPEEERLRKSLPQLAAEDDIPLVATNDVHYLLPEHNYARAVMCEMSGDVPPYWEQHTMFSDQFYFKNQEEMAELFKDLPEAIQNTVVIAQRCEGVKIPRERALPEFPVPAGETIESYFEKVTWEGFRNRYPNPPQNYVDQLKYEIETVKQMGFPDYFLIVWDFVKFAKENDIPVGPGRGSAAGALVSDCLGITELDPIEHNLVFERFLNPHRVTMPDIDIDFCFEKRHLMIEYVTRKYGHEHVAQIITFGTLGARAAIKDVGRVLGISYSLTDEMSKEISDDTESLADARELAYFQEKLATDDKIRALFEVGEIVEGLPRHTSVHAAGVVISRKPLLECVPMMEVDGILITQWDMEEVQEAGLLKMDFLGLKTLTIMEYTFENIRQTRGIDMTMRDIPMDDPKTYELLRSGRTNRVFQLESGGMQKVLRDMQPTNFQDVSAVLALYRPGPMQFIPQYIEGKRTGKWKVPHPLLKDILDETHGIIVYQEQIQLVAQRLAGYSLGEADLLRRAVSKKKAEILAEERKNFVGKATALGIDEKVANEVYDMIVLFADYGFNRAHTAAYGVISVMTAYLKANFPVEFMAANLTVAIGDSEKLASILMECRRMGITILPPSVEKSKPIFTVEDGAIRYGLMGVRGVGEAFAKAIVETPGCTTFEDLLQRIPSHLYTKASWENLIHAGACDLFGNRGTLLAHLGNLIDFAREMQDYRRKGQLTFFDLGLIGPAPLQVMPDPPHLDLLKEEKRVLQIILSGHPLDSCDDLISPIATNSLIDLDDSFSGEQCVVAGVFSDVKTILTKKGQKMAFASLGDQTSELEVVIFPKTYEKVQKHLKVMTPAFVYGKVEWDPKEERAKIICDHVKPILTGRQVIYISVRDDEHQRRLTRAISDQNGITSVLLYHQGKKQLVQAGFSIRLNQQTWDHLASEKYTIA